MDKEYDLVAWWIYKKSASSAIQDVIVQHEPFLDTEGFEEADIITLDVDQKGDGAGPLTIILEIEEA
jgi:hypothetical protein